MKKTTYKPSITRIDLDPADFVKIKRLLADRGMTQTAMLSRLVRWYAKQDEVTQTAIITAARDGSIDQVARQILNRFA